MDGECHVALHDEDAHEPPGEPEHGAGPDGVLHEREDRPVVADPAEQGGPDVGGVHAGASPCSRSW